MISAPRLAEVVELLGLTSDIELLIMGSIMAASCCSVSSGVVPTNDSELVSELEADPVVVPPHCVRRMVKVKTMKGMKTCFLVKVIDLIITDLDNRWNKKHNDINR